MSSSSYPEHAVPHFINSPLPVALGKVKKKRNIRNVIFNIGLVYILSQIVTGADTANLSSSSSAAKYSESNGDFTSFVKAANNNASLPPRLRATVNCTPPAIADFPQDLFTQEQRLQGFVAIHILSSMYIFYALSLVCDEYFVPSVERICDEFHVPKDVGGATFMAIATSSPELFINLIGTFLTKGDIGVGTVVGSAVCNVLGVCACCGIAAKNALPLEWYPLTRDCLFYSFAVILLIVFIRNQQIFWYHALVLVLAYFVYLIIMYKNASIKKWAENLVEQRTSLFGYNNENQSENGDAPMQGTDNERTSLLGLTEVDDTLASLHTSPDDEEVKWSLMRLPNEGGFFTSVHWVISWPARFAFTFTIPNCKEEKQKNLYLVTFFMCMVWIGASSYFVAWLVTIIGHTLSIADSIMAITFLAIGATMPEIVSSILVVRKGHGMMGISNSLGSNTFDMLMCLGLPWLIRSIMLTANSDPVSYVQINSGGFEYSLVLLLISVLMLYLILACNRFYLDRKVGLIALVLYCGFILFACLFELNIFFPVNLPVCDTDL